MEEFKVIGDLEKDNSLEGRNKDLLLFFSKYEKEDDYHSHRENLSKLSEFYLREIIQLGDFELPDIGPNPEILNFHLSLEGWKKEYIEEIKHAIKIYEGGNIESLEEAVILIEILKRNHPEKREILEKLIDDLINNKFTNLFDYTNMLKIEKEHPNQILFSSLFFYFATLLE
jgi:hypothetical protein